MSPSAERFHHWTKPPKNPVGHAVGELQLVASLASVLEKRVSIRPGERLVLVSEFANQHGVADLVAAVVKATSTASDATRGLERPQSASLFAALRRQPEGSTSTEIAIQFGISVDSARKSLRALTESGLVEKRSGKYLAAKRTAAVRYIVAVEAKLKDWKRALAQAQRYRLFSNEVYVALPPEPARTAATNREVFENYGVGILAVAPQKHRVLVRAKRGQPLSQAHRLTAEAILIRAISPVPPRARSHPAQSPNSRDG